VLELDCGLEFDAARAHEDFFPALPARPAVCLIEPREENAEPFLIRTQNLQRRLQRLLGPVDPASKRLNLSDFARGIRYRLIGSPFEQTLTCYQHAKQLFPKRYRDLMRLRPAAVLKVNLRNAYPRCYVTRRIPVDEAGVLTGGAYYGPFASRRSAQAFAERVLDLFKVRRCQIKIHRDPTFPGCLYSEMKMCLAPCFAGCTKEEYDVEVQRLVQFLETSGGSLRSTIEEEREKASEQLDFERAAALHKKVEKLDEVLRGQPELTRRIQDLDAVILQTRRRRPNYWRLSRKRRKAGGAVFPPLRRDCQPAALRRTHFSRAIRSKLRTTRGRSRRAPVAGGALVLQQSARRRNFLPRKRLALS